MPATLQEALSRVTLDYLNRTDFDAQAIRAIQAGIRHYEQQRWPWNQTSTALTAVVSGTAITVPTDLLILDRMEVTFQSTQYQMTERSFDEIQQMNAVDGAGNLPLYYHMRGHQFLLSPVPESAYPITCYYVHRLPELSSNSMTSTNSWLSAAEDLIVYHATKLMWANVLRNTEEATKFAQLEQGAFLQLTGERDQRLHTRIRKTRF